MSRFRFAVLLLAVLTVFAAYSSHRITSKISDENAADSAWMQSATKISKEQVEINRKRLAAGLPEIKFTPEEQSTGLVAPREITASPSL